MRTPGSKRFPPLERRLGGSNQRIREGRLAAFSIPATASAGWKESGLAEELLHLGPTRNSSHIKHRTLHTVRQQKPDYSPAFSSPCHAQQRRKFSWVVHSLMQRVLGSVQNPGEPGVLTESWSEKALERLHAAEPLHRRAILAEWIGSGRPGATVTLPARIRRLSAEFQQLLAHGLRPKLRTNIASSAI